MKLSLVAFSGVIGLMVVACGGSGSPSTSGQPSGGGPPGASAPAASAAPATVAGGISGSGGVRIALTLGGGPHAGDYNLTHTNPCRFNLPTAGDWALTATFTGAPSEPSIVDLVLNGDANFVDVWFGNDHFHAPDPQFTVDDRGETATLTASGTMTGPQGSGSSFPVRITVECDELVRY